MGFLQNWKEQLGTFRDKRRQKSVDLQTTSNFDVSKSLASRFSYLAGGGTKKQVSADTGANVGMWSGGLLGGHLGRKYLREALDTAVEQKGVLEDTAKAYMKSRSGRTVPTKMLLGNSTGSYYRFLRDLPPSVRGNVLKSIGLIGGGIVGGYTLGGAGGHLIARDTSGLPLDIK